MRTKQYSNIQCNEMKTIVKQFVFFLWSINQTAQWSCKYQIKQTNINKQEKRKKNVKNYEPFKNQLCRKFNRKTPSN